MRLEQTGRTVTVLAILAIAVALAAPASAKDEFEDGFKDELGRISAHEAVRAGRHVLAGILFGHGPGYRDPVYTSRRHRGYDRDYDRPRRHWGHGHSRHHRGHGHGHRHGHHGHGHGWSHGGGHGHHGHGHGCHH